MTEKQERKIRREAYKFYDEQIFANTDLCKHDIAQIAFYAGAEYILKNKKEFGDTAIHPTTEAGFLLEFLAKRDALVPYIENIFAQRPHELIDMLKECSSINSAFSWAGTPQGHDYWHELHNEFTR